MKLAAKDLRAEQKLEVSGKEPWLAGIYADFPHLDGRPVPLLQGQLLIRPDHAQNLFYVSGQLAYEPYVPCSRCALSISWPLNLTIDAVFAAPDNQAVAESLEGQGFSVYELESDETIDLQQLILDSLHLEIPHRTVKATEDESRCLVCDKDLSESLVYGERQESASQPFSRLKDLVQNEG